MTLRVIVVVVSLVAFSAFDGHASTIVMVDGPFSSNAVAASPDPFGGFDYVAASWTQSTSYSNVSISFVGTAAFSAATGAVYLTTGFGATTTGANQIASAPFAVPFGLPSTPVLVFSGLNLEAGTYYVTIAADAGKQIGWSVTDNPVTTTAVGASVNPGQGCFNGSSQAVYPPGTTGSCVVDNLLFSVSGDPTVSEPSTVSMFLICGLAAWALGGKRLGPGWLFKKTETSPPTLLFRER